VASSLPRVNLKALESKLGKHLLSRAGSPMQSGDTAVWDIDAAVRACAFRQFGSTFATEGCDVHRRI